MPSVAPLIDAVAHGRAADVMALLADGADVNEATHDGYTSLMIASQEGHTEVVVMLLAADAKPNQANDDGATALMHACANGHTEIVTELRALAPHSAALRST
jgi:ankyrin repeat protein